MKRIDRLILGELIGPWMFGVAIFTVLIMAGSYLFRLTEYLSKGISPWTMIELSLLLTPGVMAKTFPMAVLLATLLAFGRLSGDSEVVALKASGVSLPRIMLPVGAFGFAAFLLAFAFNETLVPWASLRATAMQTQIETELGGRSEQPTFRAIYDKGRLQALLSAKDFNIAARTLTGAYLVTFDEEGKRSFVLEANRLRFTDQNDWRIEGGGRLLPAGGGVEVILKGDAFPPQVKSPDVTPQDLIAQALRDLDALSMRQMGEQIRREKANPAADPGQVANLEFGYWNKIAVPLAALVFGLVGAPLGIRSHRAGAATGFWLSVVIIFAYMMVANAMSIMAQGGRVPSFVASFLPIVVGLAVAAVLIYRKNQ